MTDTQDAATAVDRPNKTPGPNGRLRRFGWTALALGVTAAIAIPTVAAMARSHVHSYQDALPIVCDDQTPGIQPGFKLNSYDDEDRRYASVALSDDLRCDWRFFIANDSALPTELTSMDFTFGDPGSGVVVVSVDGQEPSYKGGNAFIEFDTAYEIAPGEEVYFDVQLRSDFSGGFCHDLGPDGFSSIASTPSFTVRTLGLESHNAGGPGGFAMTSTKDSARGCE